MHLLLPFHFSSLRKPRLKNCSSLIKEEYSGASQYRRRSTKLRKQNRIHCLVVLHLLVYWVSRQPRQARDSSAPLQVAFSEPLHPRVYSKRQPCGQHRRQRLKMKKTTMMKKRSKEKSHHLLMPTLTRLNSSRRSARRFRRAHIRVRSIKKLESLKFLSHCHLPR